MRNVQLVVFLLGPIANFLPFFIMDTPFDRNPEVLIQPAGYAFSIWGPIFLAMIIYSVFQLKMERVESPYLKTATYSAISAVFASFTFVPISFTSSIWAGYRRRRQWRRRCSCGSKGWPLTPILKSTSQWVY